jgi:peptide methionine sulfoxide reductase MsrA
MTLTPPDILKYDKRAEEATETATFTLGCLGPNADFDAVDDVITTRVGYAGGTKFREGVCSRTVMTVISIVDLSGWCV